MGAPLKPAEREQKKWQAHGLSLRGQHAPAIAHTLSISVTTTKTLIREAHTQTAKERAAEGVSDLERYIAEQDTVIAECWRRLANTKDQSLNVSAILATISSAYERKAKALGLLRERNTLDVNLNLADELRDLMQTPTRLEYAAPDHGD